MAKYKIALLPGDGVGREVMECAGLILEALQLDATYLTCDIGWDFWRQEGNALPDRTIEALKNTDCALLGAITSKPTQEAEKELSPELQNKGYKYISPIICLRQLLNLHTNIRPCQAIKGNTLNYRDDIDMVVFRENTEGSYCGIEYFPFPEKLYQVIRESQPAIERFAQIGLQETAVSLRIMTKTACERIILQAFEYAVKNGKKKVTVVDKPNILRETGGLFLRTARMIAQKFSGIELQEVNIDALCMWLIKNSHHFQVIVAENLFGDIISDLAAQLVGGMGFAYSGNIGDSYAVFEPVHGSAPKYFGQHKVNPIAMLLAVKYMLSWLGETHKSKLLEQAITAVVQEKNIGTYDMGFNNTNIEVTQGIITKLKL